MITLKQILGSGTYLLLFLLPFQTRYFLVSNEMNGHFWEYGSYALYGTEILLLLLSILQAYILWQDRKYALSDSSKNFAVLRFLAAVFLLYIALSNIWSIDQQISMFYTVRILEAALFILLIKESRIDLNKALLLFVLAVLLQGALGIFQFFTQEVLPNKWLGIASQDPATAGVSVVETSFRRYLRAYGGLPHPNILGGWIVVSLFLTIWLYNISFQNHKRIKDRIRTMPLLVIYLFLFISLILTFSRSALLGFTIGIAVLIILYAFWKAFSMSVIFKFLLLTAFLSIFLGIILQEPITERTNGLFFNEQIGRLEIKSTKERLSGIYGAVSIVKKHPFLGGGIGTYTVDLSTHNREPVHMVPLIILAELGMIGFILFASLLSVFIIYLYREKKILGLILFLALLPIAVFDHYLWTLYSGYMLAAFTVSMNFLNTRG